MNEMKGIEGIEGALPFQGSIPGPFRPRLEAWKTSDGGRAKGAKRGPTSQALARAGFTVSGLGSCG